MTEIERILIARGIELCSDWDQQNEALVNSTEQWERQNCEKKRLDAAIRLDEICLLANALGLASYDDFREQIQKNYKISKEETV